MVKKDPIALRVDKDLLLFGWKKRISIDRYCSQYLSKKHEG